MEFATRFVSNLYTMEGCTMGEAMANLWNYELGYQVAKFSCTYFFMNHICSGMQGIKFASDKNPTE